MSAKGCPVRGVLPSGWRIPRVGSENDCLGDRRRVSLLITLDGRCDGVLCGGHWAPRAAAAWRRRSRSLRAQGESSLGPDLDDVCETGQKAAVSHADRDPDRVVACCDAGRGVVARESEHRGPHGRRIARSSAGRPSSAASSCPLAPVGAWDRVGAPGDHRLWVRGQWLAAYPRGLRAGDAGGWQRPRHVCVRRCGAEATWEAMKLFTGVEGSTIVTRAPATRPCGRHQPRQPSPDGS